MERTVKISSLAKKDFGSGNILLQSDYHTISDNEFAMRWELYDPMDSFISKIYGSWYLKTISVNGNPETYIRSFGATLLKNAPPGVLFFTRTFGKSEVVKTFRNLLDLK